MDYLSDILSKGHWPHKKSKKKHLRTVELKMKIDCDGCDLKIKNALSSLRGVQSVVTDRKQHKVAVTGYVDEEKVIKAAKSTGKKVELWPYVPYSVVPRSYVAQAYDKRAPPGCVRKIDYMATASPRFIEEENYVNMFSDENPNACSVM